MWTVAAITVATCIKMSRKARFNVFFKFPMPVPPL